MASAEFNFNGEFILGPSQTYFRYIFVGLGTTARPLGTERTLPVWKYLSSYQHEARSAGLCPASGRRPTNY